MLLVQSSYVHDCKEWHSNHEVPIDSNTTTATRLLEDTRLQERELEV
jgi:hypothetical protein